MPEVSVIIPTYQSMQFVREAVDSVLAQTYKDYEVIVVDGGSTDGTREVLSSYGSHIRVVSQNARGISNARNIGVSTSKGKYIAFLDSDDLWLPRKLEVQVKFLKSMPNIVGLIYSDAIFFSEEEDCKPKRKSSRMRKPYKGKVIKHLLRENFIVTSTVMVRKLCFEKVGYFDESLAVSEDSDMWIRIAEYFNIDHQDMVLAKIRRNAGSVTRSDRERRFRSVIALRNKLIPHLLKEFKSESFYRRYYLPYLAYGFEYLLENEPRNAKQKLRQYIKLYPYNINAYFLLLLTFFPSNLRSRLQLNRYVPEILWQRLYKNLQNN